MFNLIYLLWFLIFVLISFSELDIHIIVNHILLLCKMKKFIDLFKFHARSQQCIFHPESNLKVIYINQLCFKTELCLNQNFLSKILHLFSSHWQFINTFDCTQVMFLLAIPSGSVGNIKRIAENCFEIFELSTHINRRLFDALYKLFNLTWRWFLWILSNLLLSLFFRIWLKNLHSLWYFS